MSTILFCKVMMFSLRQNINNILKTTSVKANMILDETGKMLNA